MEHCNARKHGHGDLPRREPGTWAGEGYCKRTAGWGTDHSGTGRCRQHGGATPIKSGRYSRVQREKLGELIERHAADEEPLDILPELAAARALLEDYINRYDDIVEALLAWNRERAADGKKPVKVPDIEDLIHSVDKIARIAQREKRLRLDGAISRKDLLRILTEMTRAVERHVDDPETRKAIRDDWRSIQLA